MDLSWNRPVADRRVNWDVLACLWRNHSLFCHMDDYYRFVFPIFYAYIMRNVRYLTADSMGTGVEYHGATLLTLRNFPYIYLSMNEVPSKTTTNIFPTTSNQNRTLKLLIRANRRLVPTSETSFFVAARMLGNFCFLIFERRSF